MFKNLTLCRIVGLPELPAVEAALAGEAFSPCVATQQKATGWVPPRGAEHGALVEAVNGQWIARFVIETKAVPGDALRRRVDELAAKIEDTTGRRPGKLERKDLSDNALQELLPHAFARQAAAWVWIDPQAKLLAVDAASVARVDEVTSCLVRALGVQLQLVQSKNTPQSAMARWLVSDDGDEMHNAGLSLGRAATLVAEGEQPARVKFDKHDLCTDEVSQHVRDGKLPVALQLGWEDRVQFTLTDRLQLKGLKFDIDLAGQADASDRFDADVAICTAELSDMITALLDALGGEQVAQPH